MKFLIIFNVLTDQLFPLETELDGRIPTWAYVSDDIEDYINVKAFWKNFNVKYNWPQWMCVNRSPNSPVWKEFFKKIFLTVSDSNNVVQDHELFDWRLHCWHGEMSLSERRAGKYEKHLAPSHSSKLANEDHLLRWAEAKKW